jgi:hypothetical protein
MELWANHDQGNGIVIPEAEKGTTEALTDLPIVLEWDFRSETQTEQ